MSSPPDPVRRSGPSRALDRLAGHLEARYGVRVARLEPLDLGTLRVVRSDGPDWVARVHPAARPAAATAGDAALLAHLAAAGYPAERCAVPEPVSELDGQAVLVTEHVAAVPICSRREAIRGQGGLRALGELVGRLPALPQAAATARPGGAWHHLADGSPADEIAALRTLLASVPEPAPADVAEVARLADLVAGLDPLADLPHGLIHPDPVLVNVVASVERGLVLIDWTGAGSGPRLWPLGFLLWSEGAKDPRRIDRVVAGYRRHVQLEPAELDRLEPAVLARPVIFAAWSFATGRLSAAKAAAAAIDASRRVPAIAERARDAFTRRR